MRVLTFIAATLFLQFPHLVVAEVATDPNLKVAIFGDQGYGVSAEAVLQLIKDEGAATGVPVSLAIHLGDFDYRASPADWETQLVKILGPDFPYVGTVGNHDTGQWLGAGGYQERLLQRLARTPSVVCTGDHGINSTCTHRGLMLVLSGIGTLGSGHATYIKDQLARSDAIWEICGWHKNQNTLQLGNKPDEVGWPSYEDCRKAGAIIATGHEHSYERTYTLTNMQAQTVDPTCNTRSVACLQAGELTGRSFVFVSGLAGVQIRNQDRCLPTTFPYGCNGVWAFAYTSDQNAAFGTLFITFNVSGDPYRAQAVFKNIRGETVDAFEIRKTPNGVTGAPQSPTNFRLIP